MFRFPQALLVLALPLGGGLGGAGCASSAPSAASSTLICGPDGSCPTGYVCVYPAAQGCDAPALCIIAPDAGPCVGHALCACGGGLTSDCATPGYTPVPVAPPDECPAQGDGGTE